MAGTLTPFDLSILPAPSVLETLDFETIFAAMLADLRARDPAFSATVESDPAYKVLESAAFREVILRQRVNDAARRRLLAFAGGSDLDQLAVFYGVQRLDGEQDEAFRVRIRERIMGSSSAGPASWYRFHALTAISKVADVAVDSPAGGVVRVSVLGSEGDGTPSQETLEAVRSVVTSDSVRALCHQVIVVPVEVVTVNVVANVWILPAAPVVSPETSLRSAFALARGLGWDVTKSWIISRLQVAGVHSVELVSPAAHIQISPSQCAALGTVTVNVMGTRE